MTDLPSLFGVADDQQPDTSSVDNRPVDKTDPAAAVRSAFSGEPVFAVDEDGKKVQIFHRNSALLDTVRSALGDANDARRQAASDVLGFEYIP